MASLHNLVIDAGPLLRVLVVPAPERAVVVVQPASPGSSGVTDHGALTGLGDDDHPQYLTAAEGGAAFDALGAGSAAAAAAVASHVAASDPHTAYLRADGTRALTGPWNVNDQNLTNVRVEDGASRIHAARLRIRIRNVSGGLLTKGTPVAISGWNEGLSLVEVVAASATAPEVAIGLLYTDVAHNAEGQAIHLGTLVGSAGSPLNTSAWAAGDSLYLNGLGVLTNTQPETGQVQLMARVLRSHTTQGRLLVRTAPSGLSHNHTMLGFQALITDGEWSGLHQAGVAAETLAFGEVCYRVTATGKWAKAKADAAATSSNQLGVCVLAAATDAVTTILFLGKVRADALFDTFTVGAPVYLSAATAGKTVSAAPTGTTDWVVRKLGFAEDANTIYFNPSNDYITLA